MKTDCNDDRLYICVAYLLFGDAYMYDLNHIGTDMYLVLLEVLIVLFQGLFLFPVDVYFPFNLINYISVNSSIDDNSCVIRCLLYVLCFKFITRLLIYHN